MKTLTLIIALLLLLPTLAYPQQATVEVPCIAVVDGDTIKVIYQGKRESVRLIGVDTPERGQPGYEEATAFATRMVKGKTVRLEFDGPLRDPYGRILAYVYLPDGTLLNAEIVRLGYGKVWLKKRYGKTGLFEVLEREAREAGRGLWGKKRK